MSSKKYSMDDIRKAMEFIAGDDNKDLRDATIDDYIASLDWPETHLREVSSRLAEAYFRIKENVSSWDDVSPYIKSDYIRMAESWAIAGMKSGLIPKE